MLSKETRKRLLVEIRKEAKQLFNATVLCKDIVTPVEIYEKMRSLPTSKQGLINYLKYAHFMMVTLGFSMFMINRNKELSKGFSLYYEVELNDAVLNSPSIKDLLANVEKIIGSAVSHINVLEKENSKGE